MEFFGERKAGDVTIRVRGGILLQTCAWDAEFIRENLLSWQ